MNVYIVTTTEKQNAQGIAIVGGQKKILEVFGNEMKAVRFANNYRTFHVYEEVEVEEWRVE